MATKALLIREVLKSLGIWETGQDLPPEDYRVVEESLPYHLLAMARANIYTVDSPDNIPDDAVMEIAKYLAGEYAIDFGLQGEELAASQAKQTAAEDALRFLRTRGPTYVALKVEYFTLAPVILTEMLLRCL
jgi:hypothetical protein